MPFFVEWLMDAGPVGREGGERGPLSWREIDAWCERTGHDPEPWQLSLLRRLSAAFAAESSRAEAPDAPAPVMPAADDGAIAVDRIGVGNAVRDALAGFKRRKG